MERNQRTRSFLFPILLVVVGVVFLLNNLGVLTGDVWSTLVSLWPVLLIALGLESIFNREGLVGPAFLIGIGLVFLASNLGYLTISVWETIIRLWPVLLVAIGLDIAIGHRSIWLSLAGLGLVLVMLVGALWLFGARLEGGQALAGERINQPLQGATQARVVIEPAVGTLFLHALPSGDGLVGGTVRQGRGTRVTDDFSLSGGKATYTLRSSGTGFFFIPGPQGGVWAWDLGLTPAVPLELKTSFGVGQMRIDLSGLNISDLEASMGVGETAVVLPEEGNFQGSIEGGIGLMTVEVPEGAALRIDADTAISTISVPPDFRKVDDVYTSPGFETAQERIELKLGQAIGTIQVRYGE